jgi:hypothetical protein
MKGNTQAMENRMAAAPVFPRMIQAGTMISASLEPWNSQFPAVNNLHDNQKRSNVATKETRMDAVRF